MRERHMAEDRLAGHLLMKLTDAETKAINRAIHEMGVHVMALPALRETHRRTMMKFRKEMDEWWQEKENELTDSEIK